MPNLQMSYIKMPNAITELGFKIDKATLEVKLCSLPFFWMFEGTHCKINEMLGVQTKSCN